MTLGNFFRPRMARPVTEAPGPIRPTAADVRSGYQRGRRDALRGRKRHPVGMSLLFLAAAAGVGILAYAAYSGSFGRGGERLDRDLAVAGDRARPIMRDAAQEAGRAARDAGRSLMRHDPAPPKPN
jgi:hypothetical protein